MVKAMTDLEIVKLAIDKTAGRLHANGTHDSQMISNALEELSKQLLMLMIKHRTNK